jgi:hypothetical protein
MALHGRRLDALWKLSNNTALTEEDMTRALLTIAAAALRPGHPFAAHLLRVDADDLIVEATISRGPSAAWLPTAGTTVPVADSLFREIVRGGGAGSCEDVAGRPELASLRIGAETGTRSYIARVFRAGEAKFVVALVSAQPIDDAFDHDDAHFMEVLAGLLESRLQRRLQRARIMARAELGKAS